MYSSSAIFRNHNLEPVHNEQRFSIGKLNHQKFFKITKQKNGEMQKGESSHTFCATTSSGFTNVSLKYFEPKE